MTWLGRWRLAKVDQIADQFGMKSTKVYARMRGLQGLGFVRVETPTRGPGVFLATRRGLDYAGSELSPPTVSLSSLAHDIEVVNVAIHLQRRTNAMLLSERELRRAAGAKGRSIVVPDLVALSGSERLAIEVELSRKARHRVRAKLDWYSRTRQFDFLAYFVRNETERAWIRELASGYSNVDVRLLPHASEPPLRRSLEDEVKSFVAGSPADRERMLADWNDRFARKAA